MEGYAFVRAAALAASPLRVGSAAGEAGEGQEGPAPLSGRRE